MSNPLLRDVDTADYLGISRTGVWRLLKKGEFPCVRIGGRTLFRREDLDAFIQRQVQTSKAA